MSIRCSLIPCYCLGLNSSLSRVSKFLISSLARVVFRYCAPVLLHETGGRYSEKKPRLTYWQDLADATNTGKQKGRRGKFVHFARGSMMDGCIEPNNWVTFRRQFWKWVTHNLFNWKQTRYMQKQKAKAYERGTRSTLTRSWGKKWALKPPMGALAQSVRVFPSACPR